MKSTRTNMSSELYCLFNSTKDANHNIQTPSYYVKFYSVGVLIMVFSAAECPVKC